jgi:hypothetical protein
LERRFALILPYSMELSWVVSRSLSSSSVYGRVLVQRTPQRFKKESIISMGGNPSAVYMVVQSPHNIATTTLSILTSHTARQTDYREGA